MRTTEHYQLLANLFRYPDESYKGNVGQCTAYISQNYPEAYNNFATFLEFVNTKDLFEIEEVFAKTFHIQAICFLDLGYVLFAEDYKRGEFLVQMKKELEKAMIDPGDELADNLPNVLQWLSIVNDEDFREEFAVRILKPALSKMLEEFDTARMELKDKVRKKKQKVILMEDLENKNIFQYAIQGLLAIVGIDFPENRFNDPVIVPTLGGNFIKDCSSSSCSTSHQPLKTV